MHARLLKTLSEFFALTAQDLNNLAVNPEFADATVRKQARAVDNALEDVVRHSGSFRRALSGYASADASAGSPEQLRSAITNLIRAMESFKLHFSSLYPKAVVKNHRLVGGLYGYAQPRTATLDKAALVAQETMLDIWSLSEHELISLIRATRSDYQVMMQATGELQSLLEDVLFVEVA